MSQEEVYSILKKKNRWVSLSELIELVSCGRTSLGANIKRLVKQGTIQRETLHQMYNQRYRIKKEEK